MHRILMKNKAFCLIITALMLASCAHMKTTKKPPANAPSDDASIKLAQAANSVSDSLIELARIEKVTKPVSNDLKTIPYAYNLQPHASVDWSGPAEELVQKVAKTSHYRLRVLGTKPAIPLLVSVSMRDKPLADILRNIDYQIGEKGRLAVYPKSRIIELRYAKA